MLRNKCLRKHKNYCSLGVVSLACCPQAVQRVVDDQKAMLDDVVLTGQDLMAISTRDDAASVNRHIDFVTAKYTAVKQNLRGKLTCLDETIRKLSTDVSTQSNTNF